MPYYIREKMRRQLRREKIRKDKTKFYHKQAKKLGFDIR